LGYKNFTLGAKLLNELPKYSTDQNQLMGELDSNRLNVRWSERYLEFEKDDLLLHGGTISESFGSGMIYRGWEDLEFDTDTRIDGFLVKYDKFVKLKALYGALPNFDNHTKYDLAYGADAEIPLVSGVNVAATALTIRTLNALNVYNQRDVFGARTTWNFDGWDGSVEYAKTSLFNNGGANNKGTGINAYSNLYLKPGFLKSVALGAGYKYYKNFRYREQDLKTNNYHNETLNDNKPTGEDEEGLQGIMTVTPNEQVTYIVDYAEAWNSAFTKRMNDLYSSVEWQINAGTLLMEYGHTEKMDTETEHWQKDLKPAVSYSFPIGAYSLTTKAEYEYIVKINHDVKAWHYEPMLQMDLGLGKLSVSVAAESQWKDVNDITKGRYWANTELRYAAFEHTDLTLFVGRQAGGKVCRNGICRYVAPFQGIRLEATTRF
jgi:hypothetical protein